MKSTERLLQVAHSAHRTGLPLPIDLLAKLDDLGVLLLPASDEIEDNHIASQS